MRIEIFFLLMIISVFLNGQTPCFPNGGTNGIPPSDDPPGCFMCKSTVRGTNAQATPDAPNLASCFEVENSVWATTMSSSSGRLNLTLIASSCNTGNGMELAVYDTDFNNVKCLSLPGRTNVSTILMDLKPAEPYHIQVDGIDGDVCSFTLISDFEMPTPRLPGSLTSDVDSNICVGFTTTYTLESPRGGGDYNWGYPSNFDLVRGGGVLDTFVQLYASDFGSGNVTVFLSNECFNGPSAAVQVEVAPLSKRILQPYVICPDEFPIVFEGIEYHNFGTYEHVYQSVSGCDSIVEFSIVLERKSSEVTVVTCGLDFPVTIGGTEYSEYGNFTQVYPGNGSCDSTVFIEIKPTTLNVFDEQVCGEGDCVMVKDSCYDSEGEYLVRFPDYFLNGCDSVVQMNIERVDEIFTTLDTFICGEATLIINDQELSIPGRHVVTFFDFDREGCDSTVIIDLEVFGVIPSPRITIFDEPDGKLIVWTTPAGATQYDVFINRDSFTRTSVSNVFLHDSLLVSTINLKIQPLGSCDYLPAEIVINGSSSTHEISLSDKVKIFPNPASSEINIQTALTIEGVEVFDLTGKVVGSFKESTFFLREEAAGIYILKIATRAGVVFKKVVIK